MNRRNVRRPLGGDSQDTPNKRSNKQDRSRWLFWAGASAWSRPSSAGGGKKNRRVMAKGAPVSELGGMPALLAQLDRDVVASIDEGGNAWAVTPPLRPELWASLLAR
jgi:hypothetical protein